MEDIMTIITKYSSITSLLNFARTNLLLYNILSKVWGNIKFGPYVLTLQQYYMFKKTQETFDNGEQYCNIIAPMGWGKTLTVLYYIKHVINDKFWPKQINDSQPNKIYHKKVLVVVPPPVLKVWIEEFIKIGYLESRPEKSKVLIAHSCRVNHNNYIKTVEEENLGWFTGHNLVITTLNKYFKSWTSIKNWNIDLAIFDEVHKIAHFIRYTSCSNTMLGLSAETINNKLNSPNGVHNGTITNKITDVDYHKKLPVTEFEYYQINNGKTNYCKKKFHIIDFMENNLEYKKNIKRSMKHKQKVVVCVDKGKIGIAVREMIKSMFPEIIVFELLSSTRVLDHFYTCKTNCVLYIGANNNEGLNVLAEHLIIIKPDMMAASRIKQTIGRIKRPNNPHRKVTCSFIFGGNIGLLKTLYGVAYSNEKWSSEIEDFPQKRFLEKAWGVALKTDEKNLNNILSSIDGCVLFYTHRGEERTEKILEWWKINKEESTILSIKKIKKFYAPSLKERAVKIEIKEEDED